MIRKTRLEIITLVIRALGVVILLAMCVAMIAGCAQTTTAAQCAGWSPPPATNKPAQLVRDEPQLARWVVGTDRHGKQMGCWK